MTTIAIDFNLCEPSMRDGKKGFERLRWACKNVLNHSLCWLFHNLQEQSSDKAAKIANTGNGKQVLCLYQAARVV